MTENRIVSAAAAPEPIRVPLSGGKKAVITPCGTIVGGQDGVLFEKDTVLRFDTKGNGTVCRLDGTVLACFPLDQLDRYCPHSNAVTLGTEKVDPADPMPLLYTNLYNNYAKEEDRREGVCCVYRIRNGSGGYASSLVQILRIGFTDDSFLWCSEDHADVRPYGNFVVDAKEQALYVFVMRDKAQTTRFFRFDLPAVTDGIPDEAGVRVLTLSPGDMRARFDVPYFQFIQGACVRNGVILSSEGFSEDQIRRPMLRRIDAHTEKVTDAIDLIPLGLTKEPEMVDFDGEALLYSDSKGNLYRITIEF